MGFADSIKRQFRPSPVEDGMDVPPSTADEHRGADPELAADETRDEKRIAQEEAKVDTAVATIEAAQAIWGKRGRWFVIIGYDEPLYPYSIDIVDELTRDM